MKNNPFSPEDKDRQYLWDMLVKRDISAFVSQNWNAIKNDFVADGFMGIDADKTSSVDVWKLAFPDLESYKKEWLAQAKSYVDTPWKEDRESALNRVTILHQIEIKKNRALVHKKFSGPLHKENGELVATDWQTLYYCRKIGDSWKITGFTGYMPLIPKSGSISIKAGKRLPEHAAQHETAGPYAPVLIVDPGSLVVTSGQAAINNKGAIIGDTIEEQTAHTLDNCSVQLASAGCSLQDVFKVNVYIKDIGQWPRFNEVYRNYFADPKPVRTAVETGLLSGLLVELEMWAVRK